MMKYIVSIFLCSTIVFGARCQMIDVADPITNLRVIPFNARFISDYHIKTIRCEYAQKLANRAIVDRNEFSEYRFTNDGLMEEQIQVKRILNYTDSSYMKMQYNHEGLLISLDEYSNNGFSREVYQYEHGLAVKKQTFSSEKNNLDGKLINQETFEYSADKSREKKTILNNMGYPFSSEEIKKNHLGYPLEIIHTLLVTGKSRKMQLEYNLKGWLSVVELETMNKGQFQFYYHYDTEGNLKSIERQKLSKVDQRIEFVYNDDRTLHSFVTFDPESGMIEIGKFEYSFN